MVILLLVHIMILVIVVVFGISALINHIKRKVLVLLEQVQLYLLMLIMMDLLELEPLLLMLLYQEILQN